MSGCYTVDTDSLATRIGELRSLVEAVQTASDQLDLYGGELGPGDIGAAVSEVADHWRDGLGEISDHINTMADNVSKAVANYTTLEQDGEARFKAFTAQQAQDMVARAQQEG